MSRPIIELSSLEVAKWYAVAVGEIGIPPSDFKQMTLEELEWAYAGYKQRQQDLANIILLAAHRKKDKLFQFVEDKGYDIGNFEDRQQTFIALRIKEE